MLLESMLFWEPFFICGLLEPFMRNGRPPTSHSMHSFLHQYTGSFKKPPLRRPHSVIGGTLGSFMAMPRNGSRLGERVCVFTQIQTCWTLTHNTTLTLKEVSSERADGIREQTGNVSRSWDFRPPPYIHKYTVGRSEWAPSPHASPSARLFSLEWQMIAGFCRTWHSFLCEPFHRSPVFRNQSRPYGGSTALLSMVQSSRF